MASPFLSFFALCVTHVMKGIIAKLTTYVMQYILNENHMGIFFYFDKSSNNIFFSSNNIGLDRAYTIIV